MSAAETLKPLDPTRHAQLREQDLAHGPARAKLGPDVLRLLAEPEHYLEPLYPGQHSLLNIAVSRIIAQQREDLAPAAYHAVLCFLEAGPRTRRAAVIAGRRLVDAYTAPPGVMGRLSTLVGTLLREERIPLPPPELRNRVSALIDQLQQAGQSA